METLATWEKVLVAVLALGLVFWMWPSVKAAMARSQDAPKDWKGVLLPLAAVLIFVIFLISVV